MDEMGLLVQNTAIFEVLVVLVLGNIYMLVLALGRVGTAQIIRNCLGEHGEEVETDTLLGQIVTDGVGICQWTVNRIDAGIVNIVNHGHITLTSDVHTKFTRLAGQLMACSFKSVIQNREAVQINTRTLLALINLKQTADSLTDCTIPFIDRNRNSGTGIRTTQLITVVNQFVGRNTHGQYMIGYPTV